MGNNKIENKVFVLKIKLIVNPDQLIENIEDETGYGIPRIRRLAETLINDMHENDLVLHASLMEVSE